MARTRTLAGIRSDVRWLADAQSITLRHTDPDLNRAINQSIQRFREVVSSNGINHFLVSVTKNITAGPTAPYKFFVLDLSAETPAVVRVYAVDALVHDRYISLVPEQFSARLDYQILPGPPAAFANMTTYKVAIFPYADATYSALVWYLPQATDLAADGDTFDGIAGYEDWITWDVFIKMIQRDKYAGVYQMAAAEREKLERDMVHHLASVNASSAGRRRDTVGQRQTNRILSRTLWGVR